FQWSPDSRFIAYSFALHPDLYIIRVVDASRGTIHDLTDPLRSDLAPSWDPDGQYLYFLGARDFYPVMDSMSFDYGFPKGMRPFLITLRKDVPSPFLSEPRAIAGRKPAKQPAESDADRNAHRTGRKDAVVANKKVSQTVNKRELKRLYKEALDKAYKELSMEIGKQSAKVPGKGPVKSKVKGVADKSSSAIEIDFDGIKTRILAFPVSEGRYGQIVGVKGRALFTLYPVQGIRPDYSWYDEDRIKANVMAYDFEEERSAILFRDVNEIRLSFDYQSLYYRSGKKIRVTDPCEKLPADGRPPSGGNLSSVGRDTGVVDLARAQVLVSPQDEWAQMYDEAWRLQKEHFWDEAMSDIDWDHVHEKYSSLLHRIRTRSEVSDLIWEMQGELGTSHAYEMGGDYRRAPWYRQGFLGADLSFDKVAKGYRIDRILQGDSWDPDCASPLMRPGLDITSGDIITAVNGHTLADDLSVGELLLNQAGQEVALSIKSGKRPLKTVTVKTLRHERALRYRDWVETNRRYVHEKTGGKIGYVHIPDMGPYGFAEFHRSYLAEVNRDGLIVDVRYNRGGHVSSLLLEKLLRKRVGYDVNRWGPPQPYPQESVAGPMVALTNEFAGSDGDIFSHCFKLYKLGPLVGRRTWGGVIGIWPRHRLVDGTITTQPEFSFWFADVEFGVENYGTDPDYVVDIAPH
ncbi:MAG: PDZ domain-containing protein, partial [Candidatus Obscuribacterales bacterium]|nr:PDZ domain-containing protein [Candidatus Obscuribacterales bacterium]